MAEKQIDYISFVWAVKEPHAKHDGEHDSRDDIESKIAHIILLLLSVHGDDKNNGADCRDNNVSKKELVHNYCDKAKLKIRKPIAATKPPINTGKGIGPPVGIKNPITVDAKIIFEVSAK